VKPTRDDCCWVTAFCGAVCILCIAMAWGSAQTERNVLRLGVVVQPVAPQPAITVPAEVISAHDGDTVLVEVRLRANVRLRDVWAAELRDAGGDAALAHIQELTRGKKCLLSIPLLDARTLGDILTFGRVVGEIWMDGECESVNMRMVSDGFATREKQR